MNARSAQQDDDDEDLKDTVIDDNGTTTSAVEVIIKEGKDGSVTVEDAPSTQAGDDEDEDDDTAGERHAATGRTDDDEDDEPDNAADSERTKRRKAERRAKRDRARQRAGEDARHIAELRHQNGELLSRVQRIEQNGAMTELARIDGAISNAKSDVEQRAANMATLLAAGKMPEYVKEQELWADARAAVNTLTEAGTRMKQALNTKTRQEQQGGGRGPVSVPPEVQARVNTFSRKHASWYDPKGGNTDSRIIRDIDQELFNEGWDPSRQEYWDELESRASNYLPKRFTNGQKSDNVRQNNASGKRQRSSTAGGGRDSGGGGSGSGGGERFVLSAARVQAMKQAGLWENPKERADTVKAYQKADRDAAANQR